MNKSFGFLIGAIGLVTAFLIVLGVVFNKDENEKQNGLTEIYDVSPDGSIALCRF